MRSTRFVIKLGYTALFFLGVAEMRAQHINTLTANLNGEDKTIRIRQEFTYKNDSPDTLRVLYFNDWANAYSSKKTPLAKRFAEEFKRSLHLAKDQDRGRTDIVSVVDADHAGCTWKRAPKRDLIQVTLNNPVLPNASVPLFFTYTVTLPPNKYTPYGYGPRNEYYLKDWYLTPAVYQNGRWELYSNKNLEDLYTGITNTKLVFIYPENVFLVSNYKTSNNTKFPGGQQLTLYGNNQTSAEIILSPITKFTKHVTPYLTLTTDITVSKYDEISKGLSINKVAEFINETLGNYPQGELLVSEIDYAKNPLYGINQLPSFMRPYEDKFHFEMKLLKTALKSYVRETFFFNPRKEKWINDAMVNYLMILYVDKNYPDQKLMGNLSTIWGFRNFRLAQMDFNDQYAFLYMLSARRNTDQSLSTSGDDLIKFNHKIANPYKAGLGIAYMASYLGKDKINENLTSFFEMYKSKPVAADDFRRVMSQNTEKDIDWFFDEYVATSDQINFKIKKIVKYEDSIAVTIKNKQGTNVPISLFGLKKDSVVSKYWFSNIVDQSTFTIPKNGEDRLVLNYDHNIPELNERDNWKTLNGFLSSNKKLKLQFMKDAEDPYYNQIFYVPVLTFNIYDGVTPGMRLTNKTLLQRPFIFDMAPSFGLREKALVGYGRFNYQKNHGKSGLYISNYALNASSFHFNVNSRFTTITPSISFGWRPDDLISNKREFLTLRHVNVIRSIDENLSLETDPDYSVLNARYINSNNGIIDYFSWFVDAQHASDFSKLAVDVEYRKLFENNRQFNLRFFAGKFLRNNTNSDFFSFALDRPTDYLFDLNYLGRSESSGIYSQQIIIAEGGFKSKLRDPFANDWLATVNASTNIWRWVEAYGDMGLMKSTGQNTRFVYDSGIRLNLVTDFFELYFPVYSNNGWEIAQQDYEEKIRFIVTLSPKTLIRLFNRKWF
ncbi:metalloprotease [Arenibacter sp. GZD96]|uniref:hypothetical protein n=1 Tax=Aurantibrevibacter litoralis TaxID=3106030 RepID=UPI002AFDEE97|nr:hypothetical protein [Arenibacter sp. GZD-96]MEA1785275.1 metalloprotease [Arenibacter sp. GZD-96]